MATFRCGALVCSNSTQRINNIFNTYGAKAVNERTLCDRNKVIETNAVDDHSEGTNTPTVLKGLNAGLS